jgi:hypothetical protein
VKHSVGRLTASFILDIKGADPVAATRGAALRREQLVAAGVVGTVVVLVAFASGLGIQKNQRAGSLPSQGPVQAGSAAPTPSRVPVSAARPTSPPGQPGGAPYLPNPLTPRHYVGAPGPGPTTSGSPETSAPGPTPMPPPASSPSPTATPTPTPTSSVPGCTPSLLQDLVEQLSSVAGNLVVLAPLLDKLGLDSPDGLLAQVPVVGGLLVPPTPASTPTPTPTSTAVPALVGMSGPCAGLLTSLLSEAAAA